MPGLRESSPHLSDLSWQVPVCCLLNGQMVFPEQTQARSLRFFLLKTVVLPLFCIDTHARKAWGSLSGLGASGSGSFHSECMVVYRIGSQWGYDSISRYKGILVLLSFLKQSKSMVMGETVSYYSKDMCGFLC